jgi:hypothetical protein
MLAAAVFAATNLDPDTGARRLGADLDTQSTVVGDAALLCEQAESSRSLLSMVKRTGGHNRRPSAGAAE